jgi:hypothetical protein
VTELEDRPWEQPNVMRRDAEPDRGVFLVALGLTAVLLAPALGVVLGLVVWRLANADIRKIRAGRMHRTGRWDAEHARQFGMAAVVYGALQVVMFGGMVLCSHLFRW